MHKYFQSRPVEPRSILLTLLAIFTTIVLSACASGLTVRTEIDPTTDFSRFTSYNFFDPMGIEQGYNSPIFGEYFRAAIGMEMDRLQYRVSDQPGLLINVTLRADDKVKMTSYTSPYMTGGYYSRPGGPYYGSALGVGISSGNRVTETTEVSVFIDLVDFEKKRVVWQGVAVLDANEEVASRLRDAIFTAVDKVFAQYPNTAGR